MAHLDEYGSSFTVRCRVPDPLAAGQTKPMDLSRCTVTLLFRKPGGDVVEKTATISNPPRNGIAVWLINDEEFFDEVGSWEWQPKIVAPQGRWFGQLQRFNVATHLVP